MVPLLALYYLPGFLTYPYLVIHGEIVSPTSGSLPGKVCISVGDITRRRVGYREGEGRVTELEVLGEPVDTYYYYRILPG